MNHSAGFLKIVGEAKSKVKEISVTDCLKNVKENSAIGLIDVREESEFAAGHVKGAEHLSKGIIERDVEKNHPDKNQTLYLYCGGGFRSALSADNLQKMGYTNVYSVAGGWRAFTEIGAEMDK